MKSFNWKYTLILILLVTFSCKDKQPEVVTISNEVEAAATSTEDNWEGKEIAKAEFTINGMTCAMGCAKMIENKLASMDGVKSAEVDFENKLARVEYDGEKVTTNSLESTVTAAGKSYSVAEMKTVENFSSPETNK